MKYETEEIWRVKIPNLSSPSVWTFPEAQIVKTQARIILHLLLTVYY